MAKINKKYKRVFNSISYQGNENQKDMGKNDPLQ